MHNFYAAVAHAYANEYRHRFRSSRTHALPFLRLPLWHLPHHTFSTLPLDPWSQHRQGHVGNLRRVLRRQGGSEVSPFCAARHCDIPRVIWCFIICSARWDGICLRLHVLHMAWVAVDNNGLRVDHLCYCSFLELRLVSITRWFDTYRIAQMVLVLYGGRWRGHWVDIPYSNLISVNPIGRCSQQWCVILGCDVVPVHHFLNRAPYPSCNPLNTVVVSFYDVVACQHIGTPKPQVHSPAGGKLPELPTRECSVIVSKQFLRLATLKEYYFEVLNDVSGVLPRQCPPNVKMCWTAIGNCQEVFAIIVGYIYPQPLPISFYR